MFGRIVSAAAMVVALGVGPTLAQKAVTPSAVLAGKSHKTFNERTAGMTSIMGADVSAAAPLKVPTKPAWQRPVRRDADASAVAR